MSAAADLFLGVDLLLLLRRDEEREEAGIITSGEVHFGGFY